ncbi:hypothetical protein [Nocardia sp. CA-119907]|uniref:hypothetical protein n=1 Tax=Nocardia sp. CA-119907 TaxID=3239973 RepID=UPI003D959EC7
MKRWKRSDPIIEQIRNVTSTLTVPSPWDRMVFLQQVSESVGKEIRLLPLPPTMTTALPCGLVLERVDDVVIAYDTNRSGYHADHIVLHEIGHLLLDHADGESDRSRRDTVGALLPGIDPTTVIRVLQRSDHDDTAERQAELFASLVMSKSRTGPPGSLLRHAMFPD